MFGKDMKIIGRRINERGRNHDTNSFDVKKLGGGGG